MDPVRLCVDDYAPFIPTALDGFELRPTKAHLKGRKAGDGYKFTYTLEWFQPSEVKSSTDSQPSTHSNRTKSRTAEKKKRKRKKKKYEPLKKGIIGEGETQPQLICIQKVDGKVFYVVENEDCQLQVEGNHEFNELMRQEAIKRGIYYPTCYTPARNAQTIEAESKRRNKMRIVIRKKYYNEWMRLRNAGPRYRGPWKGLIFKEEQSKPSTSNRSKVDFLKEADWMDKYPNLWPMCSLARSGESVASLRVSGSADWTKNYGKDVEMERAKEQRKNDARWQWMKERKKEADDRQKQTGSLLSSLTHSSQTPSPNEGASPAEEKKGYLHLTVFLPNNTEAELLQRADTKDEIRLLVEKMLTSSKLEGLVPMSEVMSRLCDNSSKWRRPLRLEEGRCLAYYDNFGGIWRFCLDCTDQYKPNLN